MGDNKSIFVDNLRLQLFMSDLAWTKTIASVFSFSLSKFKKKIGKCHLLGDQCQPCIKMKLMYTIA